MAIYSSQYDLSDAERLVQYRLSTLDRTISPRPLRATHSLIAYDLPPLGGYFHKCVESPINDLLFVANCPNLATVEYYGSLPRRMESKLPRILVRVKNIETWPELVVYLHTKNQAGLFRTLVPEWIRDLVHPLPISDVLKLSHAPVRQRKFSLVRCGTPPLSDPVAPVRTADSIAKSIIEALESLPENLGHQDILDVSMRLSALRDNLEFIGYFDAELWIEIDVISKILTKAMILGARVDGSTKVREKL